MDPSQVKSMAWMLSLGAGGVALVAAVVSALGGTRGERGFGWARAGAVALMGTALLAAAALLLLAQTAPGTGHRGAYAAFALGVLIPAIATLVTALRHPAPVVAGREPATPVLLPGIFLLGATLLAMGLIFNRYGIRATLQWEALVLGLGTGLVWSLLSVRGLCSWRHAEAVASTLTGATLAAIALPWCAVLAAAHFPWPNPAPWLAVFCGSGLLAGWALTLVVVVIGTRGSGGTAAMVGAAVIMAVALGGAAWSAQENIVREQGLVQSIGAGFIAALVSLGIAASARRAADDDPDLRSDPVSAISFVLILVGLAWIGFKLWLGLGIALAALGFLAAFPIASALGASAPTVSGLRVPERVAALAGGGLLLLAGMKIFQQDGQLLLAGIDLADGNVASALLVGLALPVLLEPLMGRRPLHEDQVVSNIPGVVQAVGRFMACALLVAAAVAGGGIYFGIDGVGAMLVGLAAWAILAAASLSSTGHESGLLSFRAMPLAPSVVAAAVLMLPLRDSLTLVTREQKVQVLVAVLVVVVLALTLAGMLERKPAPAKAPAPPVEATPPVEPVPEPEATTASGEPG